MTKEVKIGNVKIGGGNPVAVQSMTNTQTADVKATVSQISRLAEAGCDIVRVAVKNDADARAISEIQKEITLPLVADIHFDYRLALAATKSGADKIRINPGNIGGREKIKEIIAAAKDFRIPMRIGVNSGSIEKDILEKYGYCAEALAESAKRHIKIFEDCGFSDLAISVKSSYVPVMIKAYRLLAAETAYPLHLGVTEAGVDESGIIKSAVGIGSLLADGIGDTIRVSLSGDPVKEIPVAKKIIQAAGRADNFVEVISCPTCGRTEIDIENLAAAIEEKIKYMRPARKIKIAVMGCVVNGPGEAGDADIGVAGGKEKSAIFCGGKILKTVPNTDILKEISALLEELIK